jgi:hypothetical protein
MIGHLQVCGESHNLESLSSFIRALLKFTTCTLIVIGRIQSIIGLSQRNVASNQHMMTRWMDGDGELNV